MTNRQKLLNSYCDCNHWNVVKQEGVDCLHWKVLAPEAVTLERVRDLDTEEKCEMLQCHKEAA